MNHKPRFGRVQKTVAIVPLALLSAAWTASLTGVGIADTATSAPSFPPVLPGGASVPAAPIQAPASVSSPDQGSPTYHGKGAQQIVATSTTSSIPSAALSAYQSAMTIINKADPSCDLPWQLLAAIGRVESDHGRSGGSVLGSDGIARPAIYGVRLKMADTDGGLIDGATGYDRAVGPMQFIPSTWQAVAVDADNDGVRNPQDIYDAALGAAVYLCSGDGSLADTAGQRDAVFRYNHSTSYVDLVLAIEDSYLDGDYLASPDDTIAGGYLAPLPQPRSPHHQATKHHPDTKPDTTAAPVTTAPTTAPTSGPTTGSGGGGNGGGGNDPGLPGIPGLPTPHPTLPTLPPTGIKPVDHLLTAAQALVQCTLDGYINNILVSNDPFDQCMTAYETTGKPPKK